MEINHREIVKAAIEQSGMSQRQIAELAGIDNAGLCRFLSGKQDMSAGNFLKVVNALPEPHREIAKQGLGLKAETTVESIVPMLKYANNAQKVMILRYIADSWFINSSDFTDNNSKLIAVS